jgi:hypothetical protein
MENQYPQILQKAIIERQTFDHNYNAVVNPSLNSYVKNPANFIASIEKELKQTTNILPKKDTVNHEQEDYAIVYENMPPYCSIMLNKIIKQNPSQGVSIIISDASVRCLRPDRKSFFFLPQITVNNNFMKNLSLEAQEAWCLYIVNVAMIRRSNFTHNDILISSENRQLFIALATKNDEYSNLFNALIAETVDYLPIDIYKEIQKIKVLHAQLAWLKKYAISENQ